MVIILSKFCPKCGEKLPDDAKFCMNCGHDFQAQSGKNNSNIFSNGKIFIVLILAVIIIGGLFIITLDGGNNSEAEVESVDLTITDVSGYLSTTSGKTSYTLYTNVIVDSIPNDIDGYTIRSVYYDENNTQIGQETEGLAYIHDDYDFSQSIGFYTTFKKPNPDHVTVEIIKNGKIIENYTHTIDQGRIEYLN